jgi:hypothetical protein
MSLATCKDCGQQVSRAAASCPRCGRVFSASGPTPAAMGCIAFLAIALVIGMISSISSKCGETKRRETEALASEQQDRQREAARAATLGRVASATTASIELARDCASVGLEHLPASAVLPCRDSQVLLVKDRIAAGDGRAARTAFVQASSAGATGDEMKALDRMIGKIERKDREEFARRQNEDQKRDAQKKEDFRREYARKLRSQFLDDGMDVTVSVSGKHATRLTLKYTFFGAAWTHNYIQKDNVLEVLAAMGFRRVDIEDGYDYHVYFNLESK